MTEVIYAMVMEEELVPLVRNTKGFTCSKCGLEVEVWARYFNEKGPICRLCHLDIGIEEKNRRAHWVE